MLPIAMMIAAATRVTLTPNYPVSGIPKIRAIERVALPCKTAVNWGGRAWFGYENFDTSEEVRLSICYERT